MSSLMELLQCDKETLLSRTPVQMNQNIAVTLLVVLARSLSTENLLAELGMRFRVEEPLLKGLRV